MRPGVLAALLALTSLPAGAAQDAAKAEAQAPAAAATEAPAAEAKPAAQARPEYLEGMGRTPEQEKLLQDVSRALKTYEEESREFHREVQHVVERKYEQKRGALSDSYEKAIREQEAREREARKSAIERFEKFLGRYPNEPRYSPDVMFRLAELYFERSADKYQQDGKTYQDQLKLADSNPDAEVPTEPTVDYAPSIALYRRLLKDFPDYRLNDGATYLLGYCLEEQKQFDESLVAYEQLIARYPKSRFSTEAWVRIGEHWFEEYEDPKALEKAAFAFESASRDTAHPLYDKALYKLGWTYYRMDRFDEAVGSFLSLTDFYEAQRVARGDEKAGGDLREEALQYVAISLADENWGGIPRAKSLFEKRGARPYEAEVYRRLGNVYFDQTKYPAAIEAYRLVLAKDPLAPDAPKLQQRIVQAYTGDRLMAESFTESEQLANLYQPGSAWYEKNKRDPEVISEANALVERSLYGTATYHHQQALVFKQEGKLEQAHAGFQVAARAYGAYLERFPRSKSAGEMRFYHAECLYNSFQFAEAAKGYEVVRDTGVAEKHRDDAALNAVLAWQQQLIVDVQSGQAPDLKPLRSTERPEGEVVQPIPFAATEQKLIAASDKYLTLLPKGEKAPGIAYKAAELYYTHNDFPEARRRFESIVQTYPKHEVAKFSTNLIVETFLIDKDWKSVEEVSAKLAANSDVIDPSSDLHKDLVKFKLAGRFKRADQLLAEGKYDEASKKYIELVDEEPRHEFADKALNNAAVAYENTRRFDSAMKLYERIYREYPKSPLADAALFRVAVNAENSYDFDKAVASYQKLVKDYPASKDREAALFNTGRLLEGQQRYPEAAAAFLRYADLFPNAEDAPKNQYRAALIYEKQGDARGQVRALQEFVTKFSRKPGQVELVVDAYRRMGDAYDKLGNEREAQRSWTQAAAEFDRRKLQPDANPLAADAAAYGRFQAAEAEFKKFDKLKIGGRGKALERSFTTKRNAVKSVNEAYARVYPYKRLEWTLAALYRRGHALERFANTIIETPVPVEVKRLGEEAVVVYQDQLAQQTTALEDAAVESYAATLAEARKNRISNEWTRRTLEALNRFRPKEYPVLKEPKQSLSADGAYPDGLVGSVDGPHPVAPAPAPKDAPEAPKVSGGGEQ
ncbi:tetratricopeptide repeat protein [Pyxidicoccus parkwayensis]|uniref:Tetratricopeptide repeat protein n=2 Tax=Pyxidicoccus parkwayensis TaxID=2813578 RepID=A0ABX7NKM9_9BACT|nr:tetratricopeptide repeat protein [Pyxidicoccus parkwaysis]QSQ19412.1 tetratricopeptide repeat protein [Pyxidicoccus parkwaysis]